MTTHDVALAARLPVVRATVRAGAVETVYWRTGQGATVILLGVHPDHDARFAAQVVRLAAHCRVIVPEYVTTGAFTCAPVATRTTFAVWFFDFVEGLGIGGAHVVATDDFSRELQRVAREAPDIVDRLMCLTSRVADTSAGLESAETVAPLVTYITLGDDWPEEVVRQLQ